MSASISTIDRSRETQSTLSAESTSIARQLEEVLSDVVDVIAPVWPLKDYVAVNPYAGIADRSFLNARAFLRVFSNCETLMPIDYYAAEFQRGKFSEIDIAVAMDELSQSGIAQVWSVNEIVDRLAKVDVSEYSDETEQANRRNSDRQVRTVTELFSVGNRIDWNEAVVEEVSKYCAAYYDQGQAIWSNPHANRNLFQSWRASAQHDLNIEILGLKGFRKFVAALPATPEATIANALQQLHVPKEMWLPFLLCQLFSVPGWSAWTKYRTSWTDEAGNETNDVVSLLAIRLAYDAALAKANSIVIDWSSIVGSEVLGQVNEEAYVDSDPLLRFVLLRASEISYRSRLIGSLDLASTSVGNSESSGQQRQLAQMVFCIDVRSERIRRQIEAQSDDVETFGFAGFFGMAFEYATLGQSNGNRQLPVLLKPQFKVFEGCNTGDAVSEQGEIVKRRATSTWRSLWKGFQTSAVSCFSFVESAGLFSGGRLVRKVIGGVWNRFATNAEKKVDCCGEHFGPITRDLVWQGVPVTRQAEIAEGMLRNLGLTKDFAKLVVFCGHACQTENNPLAASLDCGACGGHSGEPNARFAAMLLNQSHVRVMLAERGIVIPDDTFFVGAVHNTTTDQIEFFDKHLVPKALERELTDLQRYCSVATIQTQAERLSSVSSRNRLELLNRSSDWSEVRPEWGLAGNAAFIVAPRRLTQGANLDARTFLHSYDYTRDVDCKVLETIMTAPMVVAHWINMQYYASSVDNQHYGSGTKTVHNVVGGFGVLSGNGGDLQTGLPWQSVHTGRRFQHNPMRLQVVIAAPRAMIDSVIAKHQLIAGLFRGGWIHLIAIEDSKTFRLTQQGEWSEIQQAA